MAESKLKMEEDNFWSNPDTNMIKEYRIILPFSDKEYQIGQLWETLQFVKEAVDIQDRLQWVANEEANVNGTTGWYSEIHIPLMPQQQKDGFFAKHIAPKGSLVLIEKTYETFPTCRTRFYNNFLTDCHIIVDSRYEKGMKERNNVFGLSPEELDKREVIKIDVVNDPFDPTDCCKEIDDPADLKSKTGRGPYSGEFWIDPNEPLMCVYKLCRVKFKWKKLPIQKPVETEIYKMARKVFYNFHRKMLCSLDEWIDLTLDDIRQMEQQMKDDLENKTLKEKLELEKKSKENTEIYKNENDKLKSSSDVVPPRAGGGIQVSELFDTVVSTIDMYDYVVIV